MLQIIQIQEEDTSLILVSLVLVINPQSYQRSQIYYTVSYYLGVKGGGYFFNFLIFFSSQMVKYDQKSPFLGLNPLLAIFKVPKTSFFGPKTAFFSCLGLQNPLKVPQEGRSCWRKAIQVIIYLGLQGEGFGVKKMPSRAL